MYSNITERRAIDITFTLMSLGHLQSCLPAATFLYRCRLDAMNGRCCENSALIALEQRIIAAV